ncbi:hypothetical protein HDV00_004665 [Rhizophlyctis rosea]|nr:hypothetical protein HDV00_004665 [Rhizophlyctis rosea]
MATHVHSNPDELIDYEDEESYTSDEGSPGGSGWDGQDLEMTEWEEGREGDFETTAQAPSDTFVIFPAHESEQKVVAGESTEESVLVGKALVSPLSGGPLMGVGTDVTSDAAIDTAPMDTAAMEIAGAGTEGLETTKMADTQVPVSEATPLIQSPSPSGAAPQEARLEDEVIANATASGEGSDEAVYISEPEQEQEVLVVGHVGAEDVVAGSTDAPIVGLNDVLSVGPAQAVHAPISESLPSNEQSGAVASGAGVGTEDHLLDYAQDAQEEEDVGGSDSVAGEGLGEREEVEAGEEDETGYYDDDEDDERHQEEYLTKDGNLFPVLLNLRNVGVWSMFSRFVDPTASMKSDDVVFFGGESGHHDLFFAPLTDCITELKRLLVDIVRLSEDVVVEFPQLELTIQEESEHSRALSFARLYDYLQAKQWLNSETGASEFPWLQMVMYEKPKSASAQLEYLESLLKDFRASTLDTYDDHHDGNDLEFDNPEYYDECAEDDTETPYEEVPEGDGTQVENVQSETLPTEIIQPDDYQTEAAQTEYQQGDAEQSYEDQFGNVLTTGAPAGEAVDTTMKEVDDSELAEYGEQPLPENDSQAKEGSEDLSKASATFGNSTSSMDITPPSSIASSPVPGAVSSLKREADEDEHDATKRIRME